MPMSLHPSARTGTATTHDRETNDKLHRLREITGALPKLEIYPHPFWRS